MAERTDVTADELAAALEARWADPAQVVAHGYHLIEELQAKLAAREREAREHERRWNDRGALRARLDELSGRAVSYVGAVVAVHLVGSVAWAAFDLLT